MEANYDLSRFLSAQSTAYPIALAEIRNGRKQSHWMWYIFPQLKGLGRSAMSEYYGIQDLEEAKAFLNDPCLGANLREISGALLQLGTKDARAVMGRPDDRKLKSSMTLFHMAAPGEPVFHDVLEKFFQGKPDWRTINML